MGFCWFWFGSDSPAKHLKISNEERFYIQTSLGQTLKPKVCYLLKSKLKKKKINRNKLTAFENTMEIDCNQCTGLGTTLYTHRSKLVLLDDAFGNSKLHEDGFRHKYATSKFNNKLKSIRLYAYCI